MRFFLSLLLLGSMIVARPAMAMTDAPDSNTSRQEIKSYWGPMPTAATGSQFEPTPRQRAAWEWPLHLGYELVRLPFRALTHGAKQTVIFLDESDTFYHLERIMGDMSLVFEAKSPIEMFVAHMRDEVVPPSQLSETEIDSNLEELILDCLQKDPAKRPGSAREVASRLNDCRAPANWSTVQAVRWWDRHAPAGARALSLSPALEVAAN